MLFRSSGFILLELIIVVLLTGFLFPTCLHTQLQIQATLLKHIQGIENTSDVHYIRSLLLSDLMETHDTHHHPSGIRLELQSTEPLIYYVKKQALFRKKGKKVIKVSSLLPVHSISILRTDPALIQVQFKAPHPPLLLAKPRLKV